MDSSDPLQRALRWLALACAAVPLFAGLSSIFGWLVLGWSEPPMPPGAALGLAALGGAVAALLIALEKRWLSLLASFAAAVVLAWSAIRFTALMGYLPIYGRLGPLAALSFILSACAVLLLAGHSPIRSRLNDLVAGSLGLVVLAIGLGFSFNFNARTPGHHSRRGTAAAARSNWQQNYAPLSGPTLSFDLLGLSLCLSAALRDVAERRAARRRIYAQRAATQVLVEAATLSEAGPRVLAAVCENLHWHFGTLWMRREEANVLCCLATWRAPELGATAEELESLSRQLPLKEGCDLPGIVWSSGRPEWLADAPAAGAGDKAKFPRADAIARAGLRRACAVPILHEGKALGVVEIFHREIRVSDTELLDTLRAVTSQLALFVTRKQFEESLSRERNLLRAVIDNLPDHIYLKDTTGHYVVDNVAHTRFLGQSDAESVIGKTVFDFFTPEQAASFTEDDQLVLKSHRAIINREEPISGADGSKGWVATSKLPFHDNEGNVIGLVCVSRDITAQKRAEIQLHDAQLQLIQAEKLESLGRLAAGIAHEVKNPLAMIQMSADYLADVLVAAGASADGTTTPQASSKAGSGENNNNSGIDSAALEVVNGIRESVLRADTIIREMLDFAGPKPLHLLPIDLNALITSSLVLVRHELDGAGVKQQVELAPNLPQVALDANKLKQVFINLFTNAVHAMHGGGTLSVRTFASELLASEAAVREQGSRSNSRCRAGDYVVQVCIEDTGSGILPEKLANVFDPFFTTKATGKGTGLGLTVTKKIIELHGGEIRLANRPEGGLRVTLIFRAWTPAPVSVPENPLASTPRPDAERALPA